VSKESTLKNPKKKREAAGQANKQRRINRKMCIKLQLIKRIRGVNGRGEGEIGKWELEFTRMTMIFITSITS